MKSKTASPKPALPTHLVHLAKDLIGVEAILDKNVYHNEETKTKAIKALKEELNNIPQDKCRCTPQKSTGFKCFKSYKEPISFTSSASKTTSLEECVREGGGFPCESDCGPGCMNNVLHSIKRANHQLQVIARNKTDLPEGAAVDGKRGKGVRTLKHIYAGQHVVEYIGIIKSEATVAEGKVYAIQLKAKGFWIDAEKKGNIARLIASSHRPNLLVCHHVTRTGFNITLMAITEIPAGSELTYLSQWLDTKVVCCCLQENCPAFLMAYPRYFSRNDNYSRNYEWWYYNVHGPRVKNTQIVVFAMRKLTEKKHTIPEKEKEAWRRMEANFNAVSVLYEFENKTFQLTGADSEIYEKDSEAENDYLVNNDDETETKEAVVIEECEAEPCSSVEVQSVSREVDKEKDERGQCAPQINETDQYQVLDDETTAFCKSSQKIPINEEKENETSSAGTDAEDRDPPNNESSPAQPAQQSITPPVDSNDDGVAGELGDFMVLPDEGLTDYSDLDDDGDESDDSKEEPDEEPGIDESESDDDGDESDDSEEEPKEEPGIDESESDEDSPPSQVVPARNLRRSSRLATTAGKDKRMSSAKLIESDEDEPRPSTSKNVTRKTEKNRSQPKPSTFKSRNPNKKMDSTTFRNKGRMKRRPSPKLTGLDRKLKCPKCKYRTNRPIDLKNHLPTHSKKRTFICREPNCGKSYFSRSTLTQHRLDEHSNRPMYKCPKCRRETRRRSNHERHVEKCKKNKRGKKKHVKPRGK